MNQTDKAKRFAELHVKGAPLLLYNAWDAGSASFSTPARKRLRQAAGQSQRRRAMETARRSRSSSLSRSSDVSRRLSISLSPWISKAATVKTTAS